MRPKRSSTSSLLAGSLSNTSHPALRESPSPPIGPGKKESPSHFRSRTIGVNTGAEGSSASAVIADRRGSSGGSVSLAVPFASSSQSESSPLAFGTPELAPIDNPYPRRRSANGSPVRDQKESNVLGLGLGSSWDTSSGSGLSSGGSRDKGRLKDGTGPPSPRRERERTAPGGLSR